MNNLVSIIMPVYNSEKYIGEAIQSVIDQEYENWELLVINDGSLDSTQQAIDQFKDSRIIKFVMENAGVSVARNLGLKKMKGDFFCFLDSDDKFTVKSISSRIKLFLDPEVHFVDGIINKWDESMTSKIDEWLPSYRGKPLEDLMKINGKSFFGPSWMIRKSETVLFEPGQTHGEELLLYIKLAILGGKYDYVQEEILDYRMHDNSAMSNLVGLGKGYLLINQKAHELGVDSRLIEANKKKIKSIMFKSFLANGQWLNAFKYILM